MRAEVPDGAAGLARGVGRLVHGSPGSGVAGDGSAAAGLLALASAPALPVATVVPPQPPATPYYADKRLELHVGHVLDVLAGLPDGYVQSCITSPPYWGLRSYGLEPQLWGADPLCAHEWEPAGRSAIVGGTGTASAKQHTNRGSQYGNLAAVPYADPFRNGWHYVDHDAYREAHALQGDLCLHCLGWRGHLGGEPIPDCLAWARGEPPCAVCYVCHLRMVFGALWRGLRDDGTVWLNLGDSYIGSGRGPARKATRGDHSRRQGFVGAGGWQTRRAFTGQGGYHRRQLEAGACGNAWTPAPPGLKPKDLALVPQRVALALQADGWYVRMDVIYSKANPMPEPVRDRPTRAHEYIWLLSKQPTAHGRGRRGRANPKAVPPGLGIRQNTDYSAKTTATLPARRGRNRRSVWHIPTTPYRGAHYATFSRKLVEPCVLAGTSAAGQCARCGAPWRRLVERQRLLDGQPAALPPMRSTDKIAPSSAQGTGHYRSEIVVTELGWAPTCACGAVPEPQRVLDLFGGSGTTALVAERFGRRAVLIELNPTFAEQALERCGRRSPQPPLPLDGEDA
jgi:DNA modification methylase